MTLGPFFNDIFYNLANFEEQFPDAGPPRRVDEGSRFGTSSTVKAIELGLVRCMRILVVPSTHKITPIVRQPGSVGLKSESHIREDV